MKYDPQDFPFHNPEKFGDVRTITDTAGIELRTVEDEEGIPYHCEERMQVKGGITGPDYARCSPCRLAIGNMLSPHINGGVILKEELTEKFGESLWTIIGPRQEKQEETPG